MSVPRCRDCGGAEWTTDGRCPDCGTFPTLGWAVLDLVEDQCVIPDREDAGQPFIPTDEQASIFLNHYRINPHAVQVQGRWQMPFTYSRGTQVTKAQKWGKAPITSALICAEAHPEGPVLFDGWDADGQPVGKPWAPGFHCQVTACSEDQSDNIWRVLQPMIELGPLADVIPDTGLSRINLPGGGIIEPVTAAATSRLGARIHLAAQDQTESWLRTNGGHRLRDAQRRGLAGTGGRFFETPNAWDPTESSVAQQTFENPIGVYATYVKPPAGSVRNKRERRKVLEAAYGDSVIARGGWIDLDRIDEECEALIKIDPAQAERWFMNRCEASEGAAFDYAAWELHATKRTVPQYASIVIGIDGARHDDALAIVACEVKTGFIWPLDIIERPADADESYQHDKKRADAVVREAFERWNVRRLYADPHYLAGLIAEWSNEFGDKRVTEWFTNRPLQIAWAVREFQEALGRGDISHRADDTLDRHVSNARKRMLKVLDDEERQMHTLSKDAFRSPRKIDGAMAAVLAWKARNDVIKAGEFIGDDTPEQEDKPVEPWRPGQALDPRQLGGPVVEQAPMGFLS